MLANFGMTEWLVILAIALLIFGHRLPGLARSLGKSIREFQGGLRNSEAERRSNSEA